MASTVRRGADGKGRFAYLASRLPDTHTHTRIAVSLIGNATKDGVVKAAQESGHVYGDFTLAVRDKQQETHFFPVRCFGKLAAGVTNIRKGAKVFVDGELELGAFDGEDGKK